MLTALKMRFAASANMLLGRPRKHRFHPRLQRRRVEWLDDVVADSRLLRGNDVFGRLRGDHDEGRLRKFRACMRSTQKIFDAFFESAPVSTVTINSGSLNSQLNPGWVNFPNA